VAALFDPGDPGGGAVPGEEAALRNERQVLGNIRKLQELAGRAHESLHGRDGSVLDSLRGIMADIREIRRIDGTFGLSESDLEGLYYGLEEAAGTLRVYRDGLSVDPGRLEAVEDRLELLRRLKRKYDGDAAAILGRAEEMEQELERISRVEEDAEQLGREKPACVRRWRRGRGCCRSGVGRRPWNSGRIWRKRSAPSGWIPRGSRSPFARPGARSRRRSAGAVGTTWSSSCPPTSGRSRSRCTGSPPAASSPASSWR
jgi:hypothetical protein